MTSPQGGNTATAMNCARYVELSTTSGTKFENIGIVAGAAPAVFKLDPDMDLSGTQHFTAVYRNDAFGCLFLSGVLSAITLGNCNPTNTTGNYLLFYKKLAEFNSTHNCFPYGINEDFDKEFYSLIELPAGEGLRISGPEKNCPDCRVISDSRGGNLIGTYELKTFYDAACGSNTDKCLYQMNGAEYCFEENGTYEIDFTCPV